MLEKREIKYYITCMPQGTVFIRRLTVILFEEIVLVGRFGDAVPISSFQIFVLLLAIWRRGGYHPSTPHSHF